MKKIMKIMGGILLTAAIATAPVLSIRAESADSLYQKGVQAEEKNDDSKALQYYVKAAIAGSVKGLCKADDFYRAGIGDQATYNELFDFVKKNSAAGDAYANYVLGLMYQYNALGAGLNNAKAIEAYNVAADKKYMPAFEQLMLIYIEQGQDAKLFETVKKGADLGDSECLKWTGLAYFKGYGVAEDVQKAIDYLSASADKGNTEAMLYLGDFCAYGKKVKQNPDLAISYFEKAVKAGDPEGYFRIGEYYESGDGIQKDEKKAYEYYVKAAENGHLESMHVVANKILNAGTDNELAVSLLEGNADRGYEPSMKQLALLYRDGKIVSQDNEKYIHYLTCLADAGNAWGLNELGVEYYLGDIIPQNGQKAFECASKAAASPDRTGKMVENLAACYQNGVGVQKNIATAKEYYQLAVDLGDKDANKYLQQCKDLLAKEAADRKAKEITADDVYNAVMNVSSAADKLSDLADKVSAGASFFGFDGLAEKADKVSNVAGKIAIPKKAKDFIESLE